MKYEVRTKDAILLEDFDIKALSKDFPNKKIGVNTNSIYLQIAKFGNNPQREKEMEILMKAAWVADEAKNVRYSQMTLAEIMTCFGNSLRKLPKSTFIMYSSFND